MSLRNLIEAVERGDEAASDAINRGLSRGAHDTGSFWPGHDVQKAAFRNDMNAALALHEALLPGWVWSKTGHGTFRVYEAGGDWFQGRGEKPARAFLLAIMRAVEAQGGAA